MDIHVLLPLALISAILMGELGRKFGIPVVVGQIIAGFLFGPAVLGLLPDGSHVNGGGSSAGYFELAEIGICVLLFRVGLETRITEFASVWRPATWVAIAGMVIPMARGTGAALALGWELWPAILVGAALTATSIGVTISVLEESKAVHTQEGKIILGAAVPDDVLRLFFIVIGSSITFGGFGAPAFLTLVVLVIVAAAGKILAAYVTGLKDVNRLVIGSGMMPRGEVGFVFANVALGAGVLLAWQHAVLAVVLVLTTLAGPLVLRWSLGGTESSPILGILFTRSIWLPHKFSKL